MHPSSTDCVLVYCNGSDSCFPFSGPSIQMQQTSTCIFSDTFQRSFSAMRFSDAFQRSTTHLHEAHGAHRVARMQVVDVRALQQVLMEHLRYANVQHGSELQTRVQRIGVKLSKIVSNFDSRENSELEFWRVKFANPSSTSCRSLDDAELVKPSTSPPGT